MSKHERRQFPNLFVFLGHLHRTTVDYMSDRQRLENGLPIRRPRRKQQLRNDCRLRTCVAKYDNGEYTRMQFLRAVSHSVMHAQPLQIQDDSSDDNTADNAETEIDNAERRVRRVRCVRP